MSANDQTDRPVATLPIEPLSLPTIVRDVPRGGSVDQHAAVASAALDVPALPGGSVAAEREAYRQKLVAGIGSMRSQSVNQVASGAVTGLVVAAVGVAFVTVGWEAAAIVGGVALLARFLGGRR